MECTNNFLDVVIGSWLHRDNICRRTKGIPSRESLLAIIAVRWEINTRGFRKVRSEVGSYLWTCLSKYCCNDREKTKD